MKYYKKIEGKRLYLSPICMEDAETYVTWFSDKNISRNLHGASKVATIESEKAWIANVLEEQKYNFAIVLKENNELIGNCGFGDLNFIDGEASIGIFLGEEKARNQGYGAEVLHLLLEYGFQILRLHSIFLTVYDFNEPAIRCYEKVGFKECGRRHECYYYNGTYHDRIMMEIIDRDWRENHE